MIMGAKDISGSAGPRGKAKPAILEEVDFARTVALISSSRSAPFFARVT